MRFRLTAEKHFGCAFGSIVTNLQCSIDTTIKNALFYKTRRTCYAFNIGYISCNIVSDTISPCAAACASDLVKPAPSPIAK